MRSSVRFCCTKLSEIVLSLGMTILILGKRMKKSNELYNLSAI